MTTLKDARKKGNLEEFIKEHENDPPSDEVRLDKTIENMVNSQPQREIDTSKGKTKGNKKGST